MWIGFVKISELTDDFYESLFSAMMKSVQTTTISEPKSTCSIKDAPDSSLRKSREICDTSFTNRILFSKVNKSES
jgi:hypothetical protein